MTALKRSFSYILHTMLLGFLFSFITALCKTGSDVAFKLASRAVTHDEVLVLVQRAFEVVLTTSLLLLGAVFFVSPISIPAAFGSLWFWGLAFLTAALNGVALWLTIKALRFSDMSLVSPMTQLTPLILLVTSPLILGEELSLLGIFGVVGIVAGSYCMGLGGKGENPFASFAKLFSERGVQLALLASLIYGLTSNFDKIGVVATSPLWWLAQQGFLLALPFYLLLRITKGRHYLALTPGQFGISLLPGMTSGVGSIFQMTALLFWPVPYVIAVKRLSAIFSVISGVLFFKEKNVVWRLLGAGIMVASTILLLIHG